nr:unnamed protein product [Spirometra erinaceieuropaei]
MYAKTSQEWEKRHVLKNEERDITNSAFFNLNSDSVPYGRQQAISNTTSSTSYATTSAAWTSLSARDTAPTGSMLKPVTGNITSSTATLTTPNQVSLQRQFGGVPHGRQHPVSNAASSTSNATTWSARTSLSARRQVKLMNLKLLVAILLPPTSKGTRVAIIYCEGSLPVLIDSSKRIERDLASSSIFP